MKINTNKLHHLILLKISITIILIILISNISYAYIYDDEIIDVDTIKQEAVQTVANATEEPKLNARIGLIFDRNSKTILYEKNAQKQVPMASTTKIMTAIVVLENAKLSDIVTIDKKAAGTGGSRLGLKTNDKITVHDLLYGLMLKSGNDAAVALANYIGGSIEGFAELMNKKAAEMGLINSHFITPHGLDQSQHYTTAYELACMADYALNIPKFREIVGCKNYNVTINGKAKLISNTNELLGNLNGVYGIKTGFTNGAGRCLVTSCKRGDLDIITVVLGADTKKIRTLDSIQLIEYAYKNYKVINIQEKINEQFENWKQLNQKRIYINKSKINSIQLEIEELKYPKMAVENNKIDNLKIEINSLYYLEAPVEEKQIIGSAKIKIDNKTIATLNIINTQKIEKKQILDYFIEFLSLVP
ncbi:MAG: D-alanyl-D-alanine carboxypeptidase family protein [Clostridia bacterium]